jgi:Zn-dependent protease with chaperone function
MTASGISFEEFRREVIRFEAVAASDPARYRAGVVAFAVLGYAYLLGVALALPAVIGLGVFVLAETHVGAIAFKALLPFVVLWFTLLRALWVRTPVPNGLPLQASDAPALFELIAELSRRLESPLPETVLVNEDFNAAIVQRATLGAFGVYRSYLVLGWPLMQALTAEQFHSVVAHEFGHLSGNHGRLASWIYRQRVTWATLSHHLERGGSSSGLGAAVFGNFARWYEPKFAARSFVLARAHEYQADRCAVESTSPRAAGSALVRIHAAGAWVEQQYFAARLKEGETVSEAPADIFTRMGAELGQPLPADEVGNWVSKAWSRPTDYHDTHPGLADRLRGMGIDSLTRVEDPALRPGVAAGQAYLGESNGSIGSRLDQLWHEHAAARWNAQVSEVRAARARLTALVTRGAEQTPSTSERWERIRLTSNLDGPVAAEEMAAAFATEHPEHSGARLILGQALLARGDEAGIEHLRFAMARDASARVPVSGLLFDYFWTRGRTEEAEEIRRGGIAASQEAGAAIEERSRVDEKSLFVPHQLPPDQVAYLRERLERFPELKEACLVLRQFRVRPEAPSFALALVFRRPWLSARSPEAKEQAIRDRILQETEWPGETYAFVLGPQQKKLLKRIRKVPGAVLVKR